MINNFFKKQAITSAVHKRFIRGYFIDLWNWIDWLHFSVSLFLTQNR